MTSTLETLFTFLLGIVLRMGVVALVILALVAPVIFTLGLVRLYRILRPTLQGLRRVGNVLYRPGVRYAAGHTWAERAEERVRVGLDGVAQEILPWALGVDLPPVGTRLNEGDLLAVVSCGATEARIVAPMAGTVAEVNQEVLRDPSLVKEDGYGRGWLVAITPADARFATLPSGDAARAWLAGESRRLEAFLEERLGLEGLAARASPAPRLVVGADWKDLTGSFLEQERRR